MGGVIGDYYWRGGLSDDVKGRGRGRWRWGRWGGGGGGGGVGEGGGAVGESSARREFFRAIWNVTLLEWKRRSSREFQSAGKEK